MANHDIADIWKAAVDDFEKITDTELDQLPLPTDIDGILKAARGQEFRFNKFRHDESRLDKFRTLMKRSLFPIEQMSKTLTPALASTFSPGSAIFAAVSYLVMTANNVSADYDKISGFFEELDLYLERLRILEIHVSTLPEIQVAIAKVLGAVLVLCGICAKHVRMKRHGRSLCLMCFFLDLDRNGKFGELILIFVIVKAFRALLSGENEDLSKAYERFHNLVEHEQRILLSKTTASLEQAKSQSAMINTSVDKNIHISERVEANTKTVVDRTKSINAVLESREATVDQRNMQERLSKLTFHRKQKDLFAKHERGTCQWLLNYIKFEQWVNDVDTAVLWCPGLPGTGKSVMVSLAVNHVHECTRGSNTAIVYLYCDYKDPNTHSELELLSSIARQLTEQAQPVPKAVKDFCEKQAQRTRDADEDEWIDLVRSIASTFSKNFLFVDALDECPEANRENFIDSLQKLAPHFKIFTTSHPNLDLDARFPDLPQIEISATESDIKIFLEHRIQKNKRLSTFMTRDHNLKQDIIDTIKARANGMFLLAQLQIEDVCRQTSLKDTRKAIDTLPNKIFDYYDQTVQRIESHEEPDKVLAKKAVSLVFCARRPLTLLELTQALSTGVGDSDLDEAAFPETSILLDVCVGLIRVNERSGTIGLIHNTLHKYLLSRPKCLLPDPEISFARICLTHLSFDVLSKGPCRSVPELESRLHNYQFLSYACHNWAHHISDHQLQPSVIDLLFQFLDHEPKLAACTQVMYVTPGRSEHWHDRFPRLFSSLHFIAQWGLDEVFLLLSKKFDYIDHKDSLGMTPLLLAAKYGHERTVQLSMQKGAHINATNLSGETPLILATRGGHDSIVKLLLAHDANASLEDNRAWTALDWAALRGNQTLVELILHRSNKPDPSDDKARRALYLAADEGHEKIIQMLLDFGVSVHNKDSLGSTALDWAVAAGRPSAVEVLLENGADAKSRDSYGNTILHWAIQSKILVTILLEYGAELDAKNKKGQTALCWAAQDGAIDVAQHLLRNQADANMQDSFGFTPLHRAALRGRIPMSSLLLQHGAHPHITSDGFWTPLHVALLKGHNGVAQLLQSQMSNGQEISSFMADQMKDHNKIAYYNTYIEGRAEASTVLTGLRAATQENQYERCRMLLEGGADVNAQDIGGWTALMMAVWEGDQEIMQLLLENEADSSLAGPGRLTALQLASKYNDESSARLLITRGAKIDADLFGRTPALLAASEGHTGIVQYLVASGADPTKKDYHRRTVLHWAAKYGSMSLIRMLVDKGADINAADRWGRTVLMWAIEHGDGSAAECQKGAMIKLILKTGADLEAKAQHGITALHVAAFVGTPPIVQYLLDEKADLNAEARWCNTGNTWKEKFESLDIQSTRFSELSMLLLKQHDDQMDGLAGKNAIVPGLKAHELAARAEKTGVRRLLVDHQAMYSEKCHFSSNSGWT